VDPNIGDDAYNGLSPIRGDGLYGPKKHIQDAIDDAATNSIIVISSWTYDEHLTLNKPLTIQAATGASVIVQPTTAGATLTISEISTSSKVITGITLKSAGFAPSDYPIAITTGSQYITIQYCNINSTGFADQAISFNGTYNNIIIRYCKILIDDSDDGIDFNPQVSNNIASSITISTDTFVVSGGNHNAIKFGALQTATIGNNIFGSQLQFNLVDNNSNNITVSNNIFTPTNPLLTHQGGILIQGNGTGTLSSLSITGNDFINNFYGISFYETLVGANIAERSISITYNKFAGNIYGIDPYNKNIVVTYSPIDTNINATYNYWNSDNGPTHISNTYNVGFQGESVSDYVQFAPWLKTSKSGASFAPVSNNAGGKYTSIQAAITGTASGGTITATSGTFTENDTIPDTKKITLNGNGYLTSDSTTVTGATVGSPTLMITNTTGTSLTPVIVNGINIKSKGSAVSEYPIQMVDGSKYVTIRNCKINSLGQASYGMYFDGSFDHITIGGSSSSYGNLFVFDDTGNDIALNFNTTLDDSSTNITIQYNTFTASGTSHSAMKFGGLQNSTISYNTIGSLVQMYLENTNTFGVTYSYNTFSPTNPSTTHIGGLQILPQGTTGILSNLTISYNDFINNDYGIYLNQFLSSASIFESTININYNKFAGNIYGSAPINMGIIVGYITPDTNINSKYNYWNSNNGPNHVTNLFNSGSQGEPVSDYVNFVPWSLNSKTGSAFSPVTTNESTPKYYSSIQAAAFASTSAYRTLTIQAGTYKEAISITQTLTLQGPQANVDPTNLSGDIPRTGGEAIIDGENIRNGIAIAANNVTINGLTIQNINTTGILIIKGASLDSSYVKYNRIINNNPNQTGSTGILFSRNQNYYFKLCQVKYNLVKNIGSTLAGSGGIVFEGRPDYDIDSSIAIVIDHNKILSNYGNGILLKVSKGALITNNSVTENIPNTINQSTIGIYYANNALISGNIISNSSTLPFDYNGLYLNEFKNCTLQNNTINGNNGKISKGINITSDGVSSSIININNNTISSNSIKNCTEGIRVGVGAPSILISNSPINDNEISGNTNYGINNQTTQLINAINNYWGSDNGPQHSTNIYNVGNQGNPVTDSVTYIPWRKTSMTGVSFVPPTNLVSPTNNISALGTNPILKWNKIVGATGYQLQISSDSNFTTTISLSGLTDTTYQTSGISSELTYYWRVNVTKNGITSPWTQKWKFTVGLLPPSLSSPINNASSQVVSPFFSWNTCSGATTYTLQISTSATNWSSPIIVNSIPTINYTLTTSLSNSTTYYWRVNATDGTNTSLWSNVFTFTTIIAAPNAPALSSPINEATNQPIIPTLTWGNSSTATTYNLQVSSSSTDWTTPVINANNISGTTYSIINPLINNSTYYWRVSATNIGGTGNWSNSFRFTTIVAVSNVPTPISPINGATDQLIIPTLSWNTAAGATSYALQVSSSPTDWSTPIVNMSNLTNTNYTLTTSLANNTTYYWKVNATNAGGTSVWSNVQSFVTIVAVPAITTLISPIDGATALSTTPTFTWNTSAGATSYILQISTSSIDWTSPTVNQSGITAISFTPATPLSNYTTYYWRVNASNAGGNSGWSNIKTFTTIVAAPSIPVLSFPANNAVDISRTPALQWNTSSNAITYQIQISATTDFSSQIINVSGINTTTYQVLTTLTFGTTYYWRVNATNSGGTSAWSGIWNFTTLPAAPSIPTLFSPTQGETGVSINPILSWNAALRAIYYSLQVSTNASDWSNPIVNISYLSQTNYTIRSALLLNNRTYYWKANAFNSGGTSDWSGIWSFTTIIAAPSTPILSSPQNNLTNAVTSQNLSWNAVSGAALYQLQVSTDINFSSAIFDQSNLSTTSQLISGLSNNTRYFWHVRAMNAGGTSEWSTVWNFTTIVLAPTVPALISPQNNSTININYLQPSTTFTWSSAGEAVTYQLQVSENPTFSSTFLDQSGITETSFTIGGLRTIKYYWRNRAVNAGGTSNWSTVWSFNSQLVNVEQINSITPEKYFLSQNYPNPFNPSTYIEYGIPENSFVSIKVYDTYGKEIETLINKFQSEGIYRISWNPGSTPGGLPSGVYYYRLVASGVNPSQAGKYVEMKKMLYIR
jgi:hypothetical protein